MRCAPNERAMVTTAVRASGTAATARLTAVSRSSSTSIWPRGRPKVTIAVIRSNAAWARIFPRLSKRCCSGVSAKLFENLGCRFPIPVCFHEASISLAARSEFYLLRVTLEESVCLGRAVSIAQASTMAFIGEQSELAEAFSLSGQDRSFVL